MTDRDELGPRIDPPMQDDNAITVSKEGFPATQDDCDRMHGKKVAPPSTKAIGGLIIAGVFYPVRGVGTPTTMEELKDADRVLSEADRAALDALPDERRMIDRIREALSGRFAHQSEAELQDAIGEALEAAEVEFEREVHIAPHSRVDFLVGDVGIEVKIDASLAALTRQVTRYAESGRLSRLVVVTDKLRLTALPDCIADVPIETIHLGGL